MTMNLRAENSLNPYRSVQQSMNMGKSMEERAQAILVTAEITEGRK